MNQISKKEKFPKGWKWSTLGELAIYFNGRAFKSEEWGRTGLPIIRIQNLTQSSDTSNFYEGKYEEQHLVKKGDLLLAWSATLGIFEWERGNALLNQHIFKVQVHRDLIDKKFYFYQVKNLLEKIKAEVHGGGMKHITKPKLMALKVIIPPLEEQREIVSRLDAQMAQIETLKKEAEKENEIENIFLKSFLNKFFTKWWQSKKLGDLFSTRYGLSKPSVSDITKAKAIRMNNITTGGELLLDNICFLNLTKEEVKKNRVLKGDILFNRTNSAELVGKNTIFNQDGEYVAVSYLIVVSPKNKDISPEFISFYLNTSKMKKYFLENCDRAISQANFSASKLREIEVPFPSINEQMEIVKKIKLLKKEHDSMRENINKKANAISKFTQAILKEAFLKYEIPTGIENVY